MLITKVKQNVVVSDCIPCIVARAGFSLSRALFRKKCAWGPSLIYESPD